MSIKRDNDQIEQIAIDTFNSFLSKTNRIKSAIRSNDKIPIWDDFIYLYKSYSRKNEDLIRRIPVQIKGSCNKKSRFSIRKNDLEHYNKERGVLLVVVDSIDSEHKTIRYAALDSWDLARYLQKCSNKQKISIDLSPVPENIEDFVTILLNFIDTFAKDVRADALSVSDLKKNYGSVFNKYNFTVKATSREGLKSYLKNQPVVLTAINSDDGCQIIVDKFKIVELSVTKTINEKVSVGGKQFYGSYTLTRNLSDSMIMNIGKSLHIHFTFPVENQMNINFKYELSGGLQDCIHDTEFLIALYTQKAFSIAEHEFSFLMNMDDSLCKKQIEGLTYYQKKLREVADLLKRLNIANDLDYFSLSENQSANLQAVIDGFLHKKDIPIDSKEKILLQIVNLGEIRIFIELSQNKNGLYTVKDFFKSKYKTYCTKHNDTIKFAGSQFFILDSSDFANCCNINYPAITKSINALPRDMHTLTATYYFLSSMLLGYDKQKDKSSELLQSVCKICASIINGQIEENDKALFLLKKMECDCRIRELAKTEQDTLFSLLDSSKDNLVHLICHILLKNNNLIEYTFNKLDEWQKELFAGNSIKHFLMETAENKSLMVIKEHKINHLGAYI